MRRFAAALTVLALGAVLAGCQKTPHIGAVRPDDMAMGNPKAPVVIIEYASVACPHCARFDIDVFPAFKAKYIDTGQVYYATREALTGDQGLAAAGFLTAHCAGKDKYFQVVDAIYHAQEQIYASGQVRPVLLGIARNAGVSDAQFDACINDDKTTAAIGRRWDSYMRNDKIDSTPTFVINGKVYDQGEMSLAQLDAAVAEAKGKAAL